MRSLFISLAALCALAAPATAQTVRMDPDELHIGSTDAVTFHFSLPAGTYTVTAEVPGFVRGARAFGSSNPLVPSGTPFTPAGPPAVSAGATVRGGEPGTAGLGNVCRRGYDMPANAFATVTMPEGGGTMAWGYWLSMAQRWASTDYRVTFRVRAQDGTTVVLRPAPPVVRGRFGTRFGLRVRRARRGYVVTGATEPPLRRGRVGIMTARALDTAGVIPNFPGDFTRGKTIATLRTDSLGRFRYRWLPLRNRYYALWAGTFETRARRGDSSCPLRIDTGA
jgi:hypothetical protein